MRTHLGIIKSFGILILAAIAFARPIALTAQTPSQSIVASPNSAGAATAIISRSPQSGLQTIYV